MYSEMAQLAYTDYDELNYHDNEILRIIEGNNIQLYYQKDKDWHYRKEERRWISMNDDSSWRKNLKIGEKIEQQQVNEIAEHYGVKTKEWEEFVTEILIDFIRMNKKSDVLDKWFATCDGVTRAKIWAFLVATNKFEKLTG